MFHLIPKAMNISFLEFESMTIPQILFVYELALKAKDKEVCDDVKNLLDKNYEEKSSPQASRAANQIKNSNLLPKNEQEKLIKIKRVIASVREDIDIVKIQSIDELRKVFDEGLKEASKRFLT